MDRPTASTVFTAAHRAFLTALYLAAVYVSIRIPDAVTQYNGESRTFHLWGPPISVPKVVQYFTFWPAIMLTLFALLAYLDTARKKTSAYIVGPILGSAYFFAFFLVMLLSIAISFDNLDFDGEVRPPNPDPDLSDRLHIYAWLPLAFVVPGLIYCGYAVIRRSLDWDNPDHRPSWLKHFLIGAVPTVLISLTAVTIYLVDK